MKRQGTIVITTIFLMLAIISGCASNKASREAAITRVCNGDKIPSSNKIYLYVSSSNENIVKALQTSTSDALLRRTDNIKIINKAEDARPDGLLLQIYVTFARRYVFSRRIDVRFELSSPLSKNIISEGKEASRSKWGYNKITKTLGKRVAKRVDPVLRCFQFRRAKL